MAKKAKSKSASAPSFGGGGSNPSAPAGPPPMVFAAHGPTMPVAVVDSNEKWSVFELKDGTKIRVRPFLNDVRYEPDRWNEATGQPVYHVGIRMDLQVIAPDHLKRPDPTAKGAKRKRRRR